MLTMSHEPDAQSAQFLLDYFLSLDTPKGYRAELLDGEIVVSPPPNSHHGGIIGLIVEQVFENSAVRMSFNPEQGLHVPDQGIRDAGKVIPDATFAPASLRLFRGIQTWLHADGIAMVVEVTSQRPERDRETKRRAYAGAGIPLYLLVDREENQVVLFSNPDDDDYLQLKKAPFGKELDLPKPFDFALETEEFLD